MKKIYNKVYQIIKKVGFKRGIIDENAHLIEDLGFDSIDILQLTNMLELKFNITINDNDIPQFQSAKSIVNYIEYKKF